MVEVRGEIGAEASGRIRDALVHAATRVMPTRIVLDLLHVAFIDSTGIEAIVAGRTVASRMAVGFVLRQPNGVVAHQLRRIGLLDTLMADR
nr:STAS domain-containing protein [Planosporangium thailandense]